jgi:hypothetical protein
MSVAIQSPATGAVKFRVRGSSVRPIQHWELRLPSNGSRGRGTLTLQGKQTTAQVGETRAAQGLGKYDEYTRTRCLQRRQ